MTIDRKVRRRRAGRTGSEPRQASDERGAAMLLVMIFGVGALALALLLTTLADTGLKHEAERHRQKILAKILEDGVSRCVHEINLVRFRASREDNATPTFDAGQDGVGAIVRTATQNPDGSVSYANTVTGASNRQGIEIRSKSGELLGRFRAMLCKCKIDGKDKQTVILAQVAYPDFESPQRMLSTGARIEAQLPPYFTDRQAFSVVGTSSGSNAALNIPHAAEFKVTDPNHEVPAVNVTDQNWYDSFQNVVDQGGSKFLVDGLGGTGNNSVYNEDAGIVDTGVATDLAGSVDGLVDTITKTGTELRQYLVDHYKSAFGWTDSNADGIIQTTELSSSSKLAGLDANGNGVIEISKDEFPTTLPSTNFTLPAGNYWVSRDIEFPSSQTFSGSGTLCLLADTRVTGNLNWDGSVLVTYNDSGDALQNTKGGSTSLDVKGDLVVGPNDGTSILVVNSATETTTTGTVSYTVESGGDVTVNGVFLLTASPERTDEYTDSGGDTTVNGLMIFLGDGIDYTTGSGGGYTVTGSMIFAAPTSGAVAGANITVRQGSQNVFTFSNPNFDNGIEVLSEFVDSIGTSKKTFPISMSRYIESPALAASISRLIESRGDGDFGGTYNGSNTTNYYHGGLDSTGVAQIDLSSELKTALGVQ